MTILDEIAGYAKVRVQADKEKLGLDKVRELAEQITYMADNKRSFREAVARPGLSFIC